MKLDRNENSSGKGKYALINLRKIAGDPKTPQELAAAILANPEAVEFGMVGTSEEFFPIKLKDEFAAVALQAYSAAARSKDPEYAQDVEELAKRSGPNSPFCKSPD